MHKELKFQVNCCIQLKNSVRFFCNITVSVWHTCMQLNIYDFLFRLSLISYKPKESQIILFFLPSFSLSVFLSYRWGKSTGDVTESSSNYCKLWGQNSYKFLHQVSKEMPQPENTQLFLPSHQSIILFLTKDSLFFFFCSGSPSKVSEAGCLRFSNHSIGCYR